MIKKTANKSGGADNGGKGAVITFRLAPRHRFALELMARRQHRTITGVIEWAIELAARTDGINIPPPGVPEVYEMENGAKVNVSKIQKSLLDKLWSPCEAKRLVNLAHWAPSLMSFEEKIIWEKIQEMPLLYLNGELDLELIKKAWGLLKEYGDGECFDVEAFKILVKTKQRTS